MEALICKLCGSNDLKKSGEFYICEYCGTKYPEKMKMELLGEVKVEGVDNLDSLLQRGDTYLKLKEYDNAEKVFNEAAEKYPHKVIVYIKQITAITKNFNTNIITNSNAEQYLSNLENLENKINLLTEYSNDNENGLFFENYKKYKNHVKLYKYRNDLSNHKKQINTIEQTISENYKKIDKCKSDLKSENGRKQYLEFEKKIGPVLFIVFLSISIITITFNIVLGIVFLVITLFLAITIGYALYDSHARFHRKLDMEDTNRYILHNVKEIEDLKNENTKYTNQLEDLENQLGIIESKIEELTKEL